MRRLVVAAVLVSSVAHARKIVVDDGSSDKPSAPSVVHGKLDGAVASFTVRYLIEADGGFGLEHNIELPGLAMVTAATVTADGSAHRLDLVAVADADDRFNALAGEEADEEQVVRKGSPPWGVLLAGTPGNLNLRLASPHTGFITVELAIRMPTCFFHDARYVNVPESWQHVLDFSLRRKTTNSLELQNACARTVEVASWIAFPAPELARRPPGERMGAFAGRLALGDDHFVRVEFDLASTISEIPRDLVTAIVVDSSKSMLPAQLSSLRRLIASYLRKVPESRVQVIAFARTAQSLLPGWTTAAQAISSVDRELGALTPRNGSNFDAGLSEAARWLARAGGTRRVILFTDEEFAKRLADIPPATLRTLLPPDTLVHIVVADTGSGLTRDDATLLAPLAAATGGLSVRAGSVEVVGVDASMLVRPITIDQVHVKAPGWTHINPTAPTAVCEADDDGLAEGTACTWWGHGDAVSGPIAIEGLMWGKRVVRVLRPDVAHARNLSRELSSASLLDPDVQALADTHARAVNGTWSLFGTWGGTGTYDDVFGTIGTSGTSSFDSASDPSFLTGIATPGHLVPPFSLEEQMLGVVEACHIDRDRVEATIEMTMLEIVDVTVAVTPRVRTSPAELRTLRDCVENALWESSPKLPHPTSHATYPMTFGAAF